MADSGVGVVGEVMLGAGVELGVKFGVGEAETNDGLGNDAGVGLEDGDCDTTGAGVITGDTPTVIA